MKEEIGTVGIIGIGLIGGSLGLALRSKGIEVIAYDKDAAAGQAGTRCVSRMVDSIAELVAVCDIIVVAVSLHNIEAVFAELKDCRKVITDVSSVKHSVVEAAVRIWQQVPANFVPGHPVAGSEKTGNIFADVNLFESHNVILCPLDNTEASALDHVTRLWECAGATVSCMDCVQHDQVLSLTSHLPHLLAYTLVHYLCSVEDKENIARYAAGGFRDFTRIAESNPRMWQSISVENRDNILQALNGFKASLEKLSNAIQKEDHEAILELFNDASDYKKQLKKMRE